MELESLATTNNPRKLTQTPTSLALEFEQGAVPDCTTTFRPAPSLGFDGAVNATSAPVQPAPAHSEPVTVTDTAPLIAEWQRLILPPAPLPVLAGEQLRTGNSYPDAARVDWQAHLTGNRTYAVNLSYNGADGSPLCKCAVLDIDTPETALDIAQAILAVCKAQGLSALPAWSGRKGCHIWLFFEPAPRPLVIRVLKKLKVAVPFTGDLIPGDLVRVKLPPAIHRVSGFWAFWCERLPSSPPSLATAPAGFLTHQTAILGAVRPSPVSALENYAGNLVDYSARAPDSALVPEFSRVTDTVLAPCIAAFIAAGAQPALGTWDKNALTLARYCASANVVTETSKQWLVTLSENTSLDFATTKNDAARLRHWDSIREPGAFSCGFILGAKRELGFDCQGCPIKPAGVGINAHTPAQETRARVDNAPAPAPLILEMTNADSLLALVLQTEIPPDKIDAGIFPLLRVTDTNKPDRKEPVHGRIWDAAVAGFSTPAAVLSFLERRPEPPDAVLCEEIAARTEWFRGCPLPPETERAALIARAADLTARRALMLALAQGNLATTGKQPLATVLGDLQRAATRLQADTGATWGAPLTAYATELLEGLTLTARPAVVTPFETLNRLLGGGFHGGKLYVLAAPPGGGKTTLSAQLADFAAANKTPVCYCALEMGRNQLFDYALARATGINSAIIENRSFRQRDELKTVLLAAQDYLLNTAPCLTVLEGGWDTTPAQLATWVTQARARFQLAETEPMLIVVDYLQLLNTGDIALDSSPNETPRISTIAVQLKQLARDYNVAVLALSDIIKSEQSDALKGHEFTLNAIRGSNRVAHAADVGMALYSEAGQQAGGKAAHDAWEMMQIKAGDSPYAADFKRALDDLIATHPLGGQGSVVHSRLELLKNRGGSGRGSQVLLYERAFHRFKGLSVFGQDGAEGRGDTEFEPAPARSFIAPVEELEPVTWCGQ